ncbi:MAG: hypothetical protein ACI4OB_06820 [Christensenellales bacterium]
MSKYLITKSLISSLDYVFDCDEDYKEKAYADFLSTLRREKTPPNEKMLNGINFENAVYSIVQGQASVSPYPKWESGIQAVATALKGASIQVKAQKDLCCCGMDFLVYGILDALHAGVIQDVKFSNKSLAQAGLPGKYFTAAQHPCYFYLIPEAYRFDYIVSDGKEKFVESYTRKETRPFENVVTEFIHNLEAFELLDEYKSHWQTL